MATETSHVVSRIRSQVASSRRLSRPARSAAARRAQAAELKAVIDGLSLSTRYQPWSEHPILRDYQERLGPGYQATAEDVRRARIAGSPVGEIEQADLEAALLVAEHAVGETPTAPVDWVLEVMYQAMEVADLLFLSQDTTVIDPEDVPEWQSVFRHFVSDEGLRSVMTDFFTGVDPLPDSLLLAVWGDRG